MHQDKRSTNTLLCSKYTEITTPSFYTSSACNTLPKHILAGLESIAEARAAYASYELKILESLKCTEGDWYVHNKLYQAANDEIAEVYNQRLGEIRGRQVDAPPQTESPSPLPRSPSPTARVDVWLDCGSALEAKSTGSDTSASAKDRRISNRRISHLPSSAGTGANGNATAERA